MSTQVLVSGASSQMGCALLPLLAERVDYQTLAVSRSSPPAWFQADPSIRWIRPDELASPVWASEKQCLLSAGPLGICTGLLKAMPRPARVVALSTASLMTKTGTLQKEEAAQLSSIRRAEDKLQRYCATAGIDCLILRPTLIWGKGLDRNVMRIAEWVRRWRFVPVFRGGRGLRHPLHADDLAQLMLRAASTRDSGIWPVAGGEILSFRDMIRRISLALDRKVGIVSVPESLGAFALKAAHRVGRGQGLTVDMLRRQEQDLLVDDTRVRRQLRHSPRGFAPVLQELQPPK